MYNVYNPSLLLFPGFKLKVLTFSYDDGVKEDFRLVEILRKNGLVGTFNLNSELAGKGNRLTLAEALKLYGTDMEIAVHGANHLALKRTLPALAARDVLVDRENLEKVFQKTVRGMAYAYGSYNGDTIEMLKTLGIAYARTTYATSEFDLPESWLELHPTCHHDAENLNELVTKFISPVGAFGRKKPMLFYLWGHSYEFNDKNNWEVIEDFCELMGKQTDVWFATNIEIYNYVEAFNRLIFSSDLSFVENPSATDVYLRIRGKQIVAKAGEITRL